MRAWLPAVVATLALGACTENKITYTSRPPFNPPPDAVNGFLGYYQKAKQQTVCGNCHTSQQSTWPGTKHAAAWATLEGATAGNPPGSCRGCHSVTQRGNLVPDSIKAGYDAVPDSNYWDVQCESCHGPGYNHVLSPSKANVLLAYLNVPTDTTVAVTSPTCAACHNDTHHPFVEEWSQSGHATVVTQAISNGGSCWSCHEARSVLKAWGVNTNYVEAGDPINTSTAMPMVCGVCHDPHSAGNAGQLRWAIDNPDPAQNLCMKCHLRSVVPSASSNRGPHAPQGGVLLGYAGWWPDVVDTITVTHGNVAVNPRLCAGCHVNAVTVTDTAGNFSFQSVGHLFKPDPCVDASGKPTAADCPRPGDAGYASGSRYFTGCQAAGCHNSPTQAEQAMASQRAIVGALADALWKDSNGNQVLYTTGSGASAHCPSSPFTAFDPGDTGLLTELSAAQADSALCASDGVVSVAEGAYFNVQLVGENRYANGDGSFGVHNPLLTQQLLATSVTAVQNRYGVLAPPAVRDLVNQVLRKVEAVRAPSGR
ncbi:MAG TPA: cytochrome c3 family protein [Gemmatimonadales bacterium]|nr:cytochrome c3 family protein [Gemmatimonadales bacterium]